MRLRGVPFLWGMERLVETRMARAIERVVGFDEARTQLFGGGSGGGSSGGPACHGVGGLVHQHHRVGGRDHVHRLHLRGRQRMGRSFRDPAR